jgi:hypothetical protein
MAYMQRHVNCGIFTFGASRDNKTNMVCFPVLATQSYREGELTVTLLANKAAKSRILPQALGRPIVVLYQSDVQDVGTFYSVRSFVRFNTHPKQRV